MYKRIGKIGKFTLGILVSATLVSCGLKEKLGDTPYCSGHGSSFATGTSRVGFNDNFAPGMRAFVEYGGETVELHPFYKAPTSYDFTIPEQVSTVEKFTVYAIDRDGNKSKPKTIYTLDGVLFDEPPPKSK